MEVQKSREELIKLGKDNSLEHKSNDVNKLENQINDNFR